MRVRASRPPFAGLANLSEAQLHRLPTPCYLLDEAQLRRNGEILLGVQQRTGCRILLAQKAFSNFNVYPVLAPYLAGTEASGLYESRLGREELPEKENHVFCAAYRTDQFEELLQYAGRCGLPLPEREAQALLSVSEGWIAMIYLMFRAYAQTGVWRFDAKGMDALMEQVMFEPLDERRRFFLLDLCMAEAFTAEQAAFVWREPDADALLHLSLIHI